MNVIKPKLPVVFAILIVFLFSSCFEIIEEVNLNNDGSGSFCLTINLSQSKMDINAMLLLDSINGRPVPKVDNMKTILTDMEASLQKDPGLSNIKVAKNWDDYIFSISGNFNDIKALNEAIRTAYSLVNPPDAATVAMKDNFSFSQKIFKRLYNVDLVTDYQSLPEKDKLVFKKAKYTSVYRFKSLVSACSNPAALKSKSGTSVMLKANISDILSNSKSIANSITLN
jgi:hypothetical protein